VRIKGGLRALANSNVQMNVAGIVDATAKCVWVPNVISADADSQPSSPGYPVRGRVRRRADDSDTVRATNRTWRRLRASPSEWWSASSCGPWQWPSFWP